MGEQDDFTASDSELLLAFANIQIDRNSLQTMVKQLSDRSKCKGFDGRSGNIILDFDRWLIAVLSYIRGRLMTCVLGTKYGWSAPSYLDKIDAQSSARFSAGGTMGSGVGVSGELGQGPGVGKVHEQFTSLFQRTAYGSGLDLQINARSKQSSPTSLRGASAYTGYEREREPADFSRTCESNAPNDSSFLRDDFIDNIAGRAGGYYSDQADGVIEVKGGTDAVASDSAENDRPEDSGRGDSGIGLRPNSFSLDTRQRTLSADLTSNLSAKSEWTRMVASRSANNVNNAAADGGSGNGNGGGGVRVPTISLPPVKAQQMRNKAAKKKMLLNNGFDESFGRATPRCLKSDTLLASSVNGRSYNSAKGQTLGSFGGQNKDLDNAYPVLTDAKKIMDTVEVLRRGKCCVVRIE